MPAPEDYIKNKTNEITKDLMQNYQNKPLKGGVAHTIGKLNGDGTATLPDGSQVKVKERGTPGVYAHLYNMGNGEWLADCPSPKQVQTGGDEPLLAYSAAVQLQQIEDVSVYENQVISTIGTGSHSSLYYFNIIGVKGIKVKDSITNTEYDIDPQLYESVRGLESPELNWLFFLQGGQSYTRTWNGPYLCSSPVTWTLPESIPIFVDKMRYSYSGPQVVFSPTCKDLLIYQVSDTYLYSNVVEQEGTRIRSNQVDVGSLLFKYVLLQDFYLLDGILKCNNVKTGSFTPPPTPTATTSPELYFSGLGSKVGTEATAGATFIPLLYRTDDGEADFDLIVGTAYSGTNFTAIPQSTPGFFDLYNSFQNGYQQLVVAGMCSNRETKWQVSNTDHFVLFNYYQPSFMRFKDSYRGVYFRSIDGFSANIFLASREDSSPTEIIGTVISSLDTPKVLVSPTKIYTEDQVRSALNDLDPNLTIDDGYILIFSFYNPLTSAIPVIATLPSYTYMNLGLYSALSYGEETWFGISSITQLNPEGILCNVPIKLFETPNGLQASYVSGKNRYIPLTNFVFDSASTQYSILIEDNQVLTGGYPRAQVMNKPNS